MSRSILRSVLELRTPLTRLPPAFLLPIRTHQSRLFNSTAPIIDPPKADAEAGSFSASGPPRTPPPPTFAVAAVAPTPASKGPLPESVRSLLPLLAAQPSHYVRVHIHGQPFLVTPGDSLRLPFLIPGVRPGDVLRLDRASILGSRDFTLKGSPHVDPRLFECRAVVLGTESEPVRDKVKKKRRNRHARTIKSQHRYTVMRISELVVKTPEQVEAEEGEAGRA